MIKAPDTLCILRLSAIGDTCHVLAVVRAFQAAWPSTRITWVIGKLESSLMQGVDGVEFITYDKASGVAGLLALRKRLADRRFDVLCHMNASVRANLVSLAIPADVRLGFDRDRARDWQWLVTNRRIEPAPRQHVLDGLFGFAEALGVERGNLRWDIPVSDDDTDFAHRVVPGLAPVLLISPCSSDRRRNFRNWQAERYAAVADFAAEKAGARVVLTGGPSELERGYGEEIGRLCRLAEPVDLIGQTSLKQLFALIQRATVVLCPDSGPAHMATAASTPVVGLYATSNRWRTGPYLSQEHVADRYPEAALAEFGKPLEELPWGKRVRNPDAMALIEVSDVTERLAPILGSF
ncbi:MAG: glycosyltransferase family 9 protein [Pseudomonadota bacterium]